MPGVWVDAESRVWQVLCQQVGVLAGDHLIVVAVGDQDRLGDRGESSQSGLVANAPRGDRGVLGVADVAGHKNRHLPDDPVVLDQTRTYIGTRSAF